MANFSVTILGCGSAKPTLRHFGSSQIVDHNGRLFMVDCAEAAQLQFRRYHFRDSRLGHIFVSHSHGDHCLGIAGLLSSYALAGRLDDIHIYAPQELDDILKHQIDFFVKGALFSIVFHPIDDCVGSVIYEDGSIAVTPFPLIHRIPCFGFLFKEKNSERHIKPECIERYGIATEAIRDIKKGSDYTTADGTVIPNTVLTTDPTPPRSYAYCCDTMPCPDNAPLLSGVDLLYHDSTYAEAEAALAQANFHSTARQAAEFAKSCKAGKLILGHYSSRYDTEDQILADAVKVFPNSVLADEGKKFEVGE